MFIYSKQYNTKYSEYIEKKIPDAGNGDISHYNKYDDRWDEEF